MFLSGLFLDLGTPPPLFPLALSPLSSFQLTAPGFMYSSWIWFKLKKVPPVASPSKPLSTFAGNCVFLGESNQSLTETQSIV